jgi:O-antigen biosynthesis protein
LMPEWYLAIPVLAMLSALGIEWRPLLFATPLLAFTSAAPLVQGWLSTSSVTFPSTCAGPHARLRRLGLRLLTALLHVLHPIARLCGRLQAGSCVRPRGVRPKVPRPRAFARWTGRGQTPEERLRRVEQALRARGATVRRGGDWDRWDLHVGCGALGAVRLIMAVEDHGAGNQLIRVRWWPTVSKTALTVAIVIAGLAAAAGLDHGWLVAAILGTAAAWVVLRAAHQCGAATAIVQRTVEEQG